MQARESSCGRRHPIPGCQWTSEFVRLARHVPKPGFTTITDTPENKRLAENTAKQSGIAYHADFEKSRGKFTAVTDDPETLRLMQNTSTISNIGYHGLVDHKQEMEQLRSRQDGNDPSQQQQSFVSSAAGVGSLVEEPRSSIDSTTHAATPSMWKNGFPPMQPPVGSPSPNSSLNRNPQNGAASSSSLRYQNDLQLSISTMLANTNISGKPTNGGPHAQPSATTSEARNGSRTSSAAPTQRPKVGSLADYDPLQDKWGNSTPAAAAPPVQQQAPQQQQHQAPAQPNYAAAYGNGQQGAGQQRPQGASQAQPAYQPQQPAYQQQPQRQNSYTGQPSGGAPANSYPQASSQYGGPQPYSQQSAAPPAYSSQPRPSFQTQSSGPKPYSPQPQASNSYGQPGASQLTTNLYGAPQSAPQSYGGQQQQSQQQQPPAYGQPQQQPSYGQPRPSYQQQQAPQRAAAPANANTYQPYSPAVQQSQPIQSQNSYNSTSITSHQQQQITRQTSASGGGGASWPPKQQEANKALPPWSQQQDNHAPPSYQPQQQHQQQQGQRGAPQTQASQQQSRGGAKMYKAMYDYNAGDADEVTFRDGDVILNAQSIDAGWMIGTVQRTGKSGMLPSNYVTPVN
ncbi:putative LIM and SH3 domain protein Lasp [Hypsibius exemplaris]|uniref:LIM and SH3 domain protein Lasp n=1 Tax=Hypsibius exemplaris TaxID=2072580 RepID=A0A1W0WUS5_HYPEX|nr:putative LIM and SH3 domain protein Lasp [Hypsibius exemplaris]